MAADGKSSWRRLFGDRTIVHVDMDAFFAQIEVLDNPSLRGKPVIVGGPRDSARGVVSTCSYEARRYGVRSAMPIQQAVKLCPHGIFLRPRFERYAAVSRHIRRILAEFSPLVEAISVDEAFLDMTGCEHFYRDPVHLGRAIKERIYQETSLTCSAGVAPNKFLAKLASDQQKPDGLVVVTQDQVDHFLLPMPVDALWGVGPKTAQRLRQAGIHTVAQVRTRSLESICRILGTTHGRHVYDLAFGRDDRPVEPYSPPKSIGKETTFPVDVPDGPDLRAHLARLAASVGERVRRKGVFPRTVTVKVRFPDFATHTKSISLKHPFCDDDTLFKQANALLDHFNLQRPLRLLGVYVSNFQEQGQTSLFPLEADRLTEAVDALNQRLGQRVIRRGREL